MYTYTYMHAHAYTHIQLEYSHSTFAWESRGLQVCMRMCESVWVCEYECVCLWEKSEWERHTPTVGNQVHGISDPFRIYDVTRIKEERQDMEQGTGGKSNRSKPLGSLALQTTLKTSLFSWTSFPSSGRVSHNLIRNVSSPSKRVLPFSLNERKNFELGKFGNRVKEKRVEVLMSANISSRKKKTKKNTFNEKECNYKKHPHSLFMGSIWKGKIKMENCLWRHLTKENFITIETKLALTPRKICNAMRTSFLPLIVVALFFVEGSLFLDFFFWMEQILPIFLLSELRGASPSLFSQTSPTVRLGHFFLAFSSAGKVLTSMCRSLKWYLQ